MISDYLKAKLASEIPGIAQATSHLEGGKQVIRIDGVSAIVGPFASDNEVEAGIRLALETPEQTSARRAGLEPHRESHMTVDDIKQRFATVPGIENLSVRVEGGNLVFSMGGAFVAVAPTATDADFEAALRSIGPATSAAALPTVNLTDPAPAVAKVRPAPSAATPADAHVTVRDMMQAHMRTMAEIHETQLSLLKVSLDRQAHTVATAVGNVADKIDGQTDDFAAMMGQISNGFGL